MARLTDQLLQRYHDGELSESDRRSVEASLAESPEARQSLERIQRLGELLRVMNEEEAAAVSFDGFEQRVMNGLDRAEPPGFGERARVWLGEFFEHRKVVWIPTAAVAAAAACVMLVLAVATPTQAPHQHPQPDDGGFVIRGLEGDQLPTWGSAIVAVDFGNGNGFTTSVTDEHGETLGVVWINE
jgi:anti-sigma factor RsiW